MVCPNLPPGFDFTDPDIYAERLEQINAGCRDMLEGRNIRGIIRYTDADR